MTSVNVPRPRVACEITCEQVVVARAPQNAQALEAAVMAGLADGAVTPGLQQSNVISRETVVSVLRSALTEVGARSRDVSLIIPDATTRIMLLDFDTLPDKHEDADGVVRFRLKKSLPFDVDQASVSFHRQSASEGVRVVAAVTPRTVLEEYESVVREAGFNPGAVIPSTIAALGAVDASRPTMVIKVERGTTTFAIADQNEILLYRALENGGSLVTGEALVEDVNTSLVYFEDRYKVSVDRVLVAGVQSSQGLQSAFEENAGVQVEELVSSSVAAGASGSVPRSSLAGVAGALVS